jgi:hypothetical protein
VNRKGVFAFGVQRGVLGANKQTSGVKENGCIVGDTMVVFIDSLLQLINRILRNELCRLR